MKSTKTWNKSETHAQAVEVVGDDLDQEAGVEQTTDTISRHCCDQTVEDVHGDR